MTSKFSKLSDVADVIDSLHKTPKYSEVGRAMVRCTDVKYGKLDLSNTFRVNDEVFAEFSRRYLPKKNDIIITRVGSYGITSLVENTDFCLGQNTSAIVPKDINSRYLYLALNSPLVKNQIEFSVVGSTQKTLSLKAINNFYIPRFDKDIEDKIAKIGGKLDDKIVLNRQTNQTLEQIAQAIFKSWFVDFEPVKAKAIVKQKGGNSLAQSLAAQACICGAISLEQLQNLQHDYPKLEDQLHPLITQHFPDEFGLDYWSPETLQTTADLFPNALVESELGEVPEGWGTQTVEGVIELAYGKALKKTARIDGDYPVYGSGGLTGTHNKALVEGAGIVVGRKGTVGSLYWEDKAFYPIDTVFYVKCKRGMTLPFAYYLMQGLGLSDMNTDAAVPGLNRNNVYRLEIPKYPLELVEAYTNIVKGLRDKIHLSKNETKSLTELRDTLLPKLLSGEVAVDLANSGEAAVA